MTRFAPAALVVLALAALAAPLSRDVPAEGARGLVAPSALALAGVGLLLLAASGAAGGPRLRGPAARVLLGAYAGSVLAAALALAWGLRLGPGWAWPLAWRQLPALLLAPLSALHAGFPAPPPFVLPGALLGALAAWRWTGAPQGPVRMVPFGVALGASVAAALVLLDLSRQPQSVGLGALVWIFFAAALMLVAFAALLAGLWMLARRPPAGASGVVPAALLGGIVGHVAGAALAGLAVYGTAGPTIFALALPTKAPLPWAFAFAALGCAALGAWAAARWLPARPAKG